MLEIILDKNMTVIESSKEDTKKNNILDKVLYGKKLEWIALAAFVVLYSIVTIFHEPWFDEAQAWQIARCASIKDILFVIPHYEGHPAFWHLLLCIPAKLGMPYEITIKTLGGLIISTATFVILFKSPIKRWFKLLIPFTFFFFYQYGIIVRPYGLLLLFAMFAAIFFKERNEKPWRFVLCLVGICLCSAYGLLISGGIAIAWVIDILKEKRFKDTLKDLFTTKRMASLWVLLLSAILIVLQIRPYPNTFAVGLEKYNSFIERLICTLFTFIPDTFITESSSSGCEVMLMEVQFNYVELALVSLLGIFIWILIYISSAKSIFKYFLIPYVLFAGFAAYSYFSAHHIGMVLIMLLFWGWINENSDGCYSKWTNLLNKFISKRESIAVFWNENKAIFKKAFTCISVVIVCLSVYWNIQSVVLEVQYQYSYGREAAKFLKENHLDDLLIVSEWYDDNNYYIVKDFSENRVKKVDTNYVHAPINIYPYFECEPFVINSLEGYATHISPTDEENDANIKKMTDAGIPEVVIGYANIYLITEGEYSILDYSPVFELEMNFIWRGAEHPANNYIYVRNDLIEEYGLTSLYDTMGTHE